MSTALPPLRRLSSLSSGSEESKTLPVFETLRRRLLERLGLEDSDEIDPDMLHRRRRKILIGTVATLFVIVVAYWRRRRHKGGLVLLRMLRPRPYRSAVEAPLSLLWLSLKRGEVANALVGPTSVVYQISGEWKTSLLPPNSNVSELIEKLSEATDVSALPLSLSSRLAGPASMSIPFIYLVLLYNMLKRLQGNDIKVNRVGSEAPSRVTFRDVAGADEAVRELEELVNYLKKPELYHGVGARPPRGVLLAGMPGTGKTLLARAVAGEANCDVFVHCCASDFVDTYVGRGASRIRSLFDDVRRQAKARHESWIDRYTPSILLPVKKKRNGRIPSAIIFIDELDALAKVRSGSTFGNDERDQTLNQLLTEMDGFVSNRDVTLIVIAATNRPEVLDKAILRPGRFDRHVHVKCPDKTGRSEILCVHAKRIRDKEVDWDHVASCTDQFSGADLENVVNEAALLAVREQSPFVYQRHVNEAVTRLKAMKVTHEPIDNLIFSIKS